MHEYVQATESHTYRSPYYGRQYNGARRGHRPRGVPLRAAALPSGWKFWTLWQYDNGGSLPGDQNPFNGSMSRLKQFAKR